VLIQIVLFSKVCIFTQVLSIKQKTIIVINRVYSGAKECVEAAKQRIEEIVNDLEQQVTIDCTIPQKFHRTIMGSKGMRVQQITTEFDVKIKFPEKSIVDPEVDHINGQQVDGEAVIDDSPKPCDIIRITGNSEKYTNFPIVNNKNIS
jgi:hypothetical protein